MSTMTNGRAAAVASTASTRAWSVHDASELYEVGRWGNGYFSVNTAGHVEVHPTRDPAASVPGELLLRLSNQGQPAATGRRGGAQLRSAVSLRPRGGLQAGTARRHRHRRQRDADHL